MNELYDVVIIGAGPAGLTAGLYCAQAGLKALAIEKETFGGQVMNVETIENYPGFADGISGPELGQAMALQAMNYGLEIQMDEVTGLHVESHYKRIKAASGDYVSKAAIIAGGGQPMRLGVPGEEEYAGKGVAYCAMCDGGHFKDKIVAVAGGGDSGVTEALYLTKLASKVIIVEIMPQLTAKTLLQKRVRENEKIETICSSRIEAIVGKGQVQAIQLLNAETKERTTTPVDGVFVYVGWEPRTEYLKDIVPLDNEGYVLANEAMETQVPGLFAAGDIRQGSLKQVTSAVGDGTTAAISAQKYLREVIDV